MKKGSWDERFVKYYESYVEPNIDRSGWWTVKEKGWNGYTKKSLWTSNMAEAANHAFRWRVQYQEKDMGEAFCHFQDWQRSSLNEFARAFLGLGDYYVVKKFKSDNDKVWAEHLLKAVMGPNLRQLHEARMNSSTDTLPMQQGMGRERTRAVLNLSSVLEEEHLEEDLLVRDKMVEDQMMRDKQVEEQRAEEQLEDVFEDILDDDHLEEDQLVRDTMVEEQRAQEQLQRDLTSADSTLT